MFDHVWIPTSTMPDPRRYTTVKHGRTIRPIYANLAFVSDDFRRVGTEAKVSYVVLSKYQLSAAPSELEAGKQLSQSSMILQCFSLIC